MLKLVLGEKLNFFVSSTDLLAFCAVAIKQGLIPRWDVHAFEIFLKVVDVALPLELTLDLVVLTHGSGVHVSFALFLNRSEHISEIAKEIVFSLHEYLKRRTTFLDGGIEVLLYNDGIPTFMLV